MNRVRGFAGESQHTTFEARSETLPALRTLFVHQSDKFI